jgi:hypothetical protein
MLWEENQEIHGRPVTHIHYRIMENGKELEQDVLTPKDVNAFLPVVAQTADGFVVAWLMEADGLVGAYYRRL